MPRRTYGYHRDAVHRAGRQAALRGDHCLPAVSRAWKRAVQAYPDKHDELSVRWRLSWKVEML